METYLYFAENEGGDAASDSTVRPASTFTGIDPISDTSTRISFKALSGGLLVVPVSVMVIILFLFNIFAYSAAFF